MKDVAILAAALVCAFLAIASVSYVLDQNEQARHARD